METRKFPYTIKGTSTIPLPDYYYDSVAREGLRIILLDEDVLFHWAIVSANWDEEEATPLLRSYRAILSMVHPIPIATYTHSLVPRIDGVK